MTHKRLVRGHVASLLRSGGSVSFFKKKALEGDGERATTGGGMSAEKGQYCRLITYVSYVTSLWRSS